MLAITQGEPAGIGADLLVQLAQQSRNTPWIIYADPDCLRARAKQLNLPLTLDEQVLSPSCESGSLTLRPVPLAEAARPGQLNPANSPAVIEMLNLAARDCLAGRCRALVTAPVQKSVINQAGIKFSGHTEYFAEITNTVDVVMMLVAGDLRVALATTHLPLRAVADALTADLLERRLQILIQGLKDHFGILRPRIVVSGLNPHAGEGGYLGLEEIQIIEPVCKRLTEAGHQLVGPLPADTLFTPKYLDQADAVMAMYHDQGLPVLKHVGFGRAVNVTLGLPFLRTSVDHGTALDLAGTGTADTGSLRAAIALATELSGT